MTENQNNQKIKISIFRLLYNNTCLKPVYFIYYIELFLIYLGNEYFIIITIYDYMALNGVFLRVLEGLYRVSKDSSRSALPIYFWDHTIRRHLYMTSHNIEAGRLFTRFLETHG